MNYLAHTILSKNTIDYQIANLSADAIKCRPWRDCSQAHIEALSMHKAIDSFTDNNTHVQRAKLRLGKGYLKGVIIDITFDHFVRKHWDRYISIDFDLFVSGFYTQAKQASHGFPQVAEKFIQRVILYDFLNQYQEFESLESVFERFNKRLSKRLLAKESATDYFPRLTAQYNEIEDDFLLFFPELIQLFLTNSQAQQDEHYFLLSSSSL